METSALTDQLALLPLRANDVAVSGVIWQPLMQVKTAQNEAKQLIKREQCDYFVVHQRGNRAQCGMVKKLPAAKHYYSLALLLIDKLGGDWLAIFALADQRYLLLGVEGGQVVPGCDAIFTASEAVLERFESYKSLFNWKTIYAPATLGLVGDALDLPQLLKSVTIKPAQRILYVNELNQQSKRLGMKLMAASLIGAVVLGGWYYYQQREAAEAEARRLAALRALQAQQRQPEVLEAWRQQPPAGKLLSYCVRAITQYPVTLGGWQASAIFCDQRSSKAIYQRLASATVNSFTAAVAARYADSYQFLHNGESAQIDQPMTVGGERGPEQLQPIRRLASNLVSKMQAGSASGKVEDVLSTGKKSANFELVTQSSPLMLLQDITFDGVVINHLTATMSADGILTWKISGVIYGQ